MSPPELSTYCLPVCIDSLLGTNKIPSHTERRSILEGLIGPEKKLQELRAEIEKMEEQLQCLMRNEEDLALKIAPYQELLSPFRRMPDDILKEIFIACLPDEYASVIDIRKPPLLLTRISRHLRQVALETPRLWTRISIPIVLPCFTEWRDDRDDSRASVAERTMLKYTKAVNDWLGRTGGCDIEIFVHEFGNDSADRYVEGIFEILIRLASRWKSISLHCSAYSIQKFCVMLGQLSSQINFPRLEHLSLDISSSYLEQEDPQEQYNYVSRLPHAFLRSVRLVMPMDNYEQYHFQWSHLAYLSLGSILYPSSLHSIVKILNTCTNLVSCKLYVKMDNTQLRLCLPHLKKISLVFDQEAWFNNTPLSYYKQSEDAYALCYHLEMPLLERITYDASVDFLPLLGLVHRMGDHLTHLSVTHFEVPTELIECLKACPRLIALDVSKPDGIPRASRRHYQWFRPAPWASSLVSWATAGDQLLRYLMAAGDVDAMIRSQLCPHLQHLAYHISEGPMSCEAIEAFIIDKCSTTEGVDSRLEGMSVYVRGGQQDLQRLRRSVEAQLLAGLHLRLSLSGSATRYNLMEHSMYLIMRQTKWWDDEGSTETSLL